MAVFKYYNVQLLPIDTKRHGDVGPAGYQKVFVQLGKRTESARKKRALDTIGGKLRGDFYFSPYTVTALDEYAYGEFIKFDRIENVRNIYTGKKEFEGSQGSASKDYSFLFAFDYHTHAMAVQLSKGLPLAQPLIDALIGILRPVVDEVHPNHQLHIQELTAAESLKKVFASERFKRVFVDVTFSNSEELEEELLRSAGYTEADLKAKSVHSVTHIEKPAPKGSMSGLSNVVKPLLVIATQYGNADVNYQKEDGQWDHYHMRDYPVKEEVVPAKDEIHRNYMARVFHSIRTAWRKTAVAEDVERELQQISAPPVGRSGGTRNDGGGELV